MNKEKITKIVTQKKSPKSSIKIFSISYSDSYSVLNSLIQIKMDWYVMI